MDGQIIRRGGGGGGGGEALLGAPYAPVGTGGLSWRQKGHAPKRPSPVVVGVLAVTLFLLATFVVLSFMPRPSEKVAGIDIGLGTLTEEAAKEAATGKLGIVDAVVIDASPRERTKAAIVGMFVQDAFSIHYHWIYDVEWIPRTLPAELGNPKAPFHKKKRAGDNSHIADAVLLEMQTIANKGSFDYADYAQRYSDMFDPYRYAGWVTNAAHEVLEKIAREMPLEAMGGYADDTEGIGRIGPVLLLPHKSEADLREDAAHTVAFVYKDNRILNAGRFFVTAAYRLINGLVKTPVQAMEQLITEAPFKDDDFLTMSVQQGIESAKEDTTEVVSKFGLHCPITHGLPIAVHLITKYQNDLQEAIVQNTIAGGDSCARGMPVGLLLGAYLGYGGLPSYTDQVKNVPELLRLIDQIMPDNATAFPSR